MGKLLLVDDDYAMRGLVRASLGDEHQIVETGKPTEALALALEHKPDAILLDLRMPGYTGFDLCRTFSSFSSTQRIPVIVISGEAGAKTKDYCQELGAAAYFQKPIDFEKLSEVLKNTMDRRVVERRREPRVGLRFSIRMCGVDALGTKFEIAAKTENVSKSGFLCCADVMLEKASIFDVFLVKGDCTEYAGRAEVVRSEWDGVGYPRYGCRFLKKTNSWILR